MLRRTVQAITLSTALAFSGCASNPESEAVADAPVTTVSTTTIDMDPTASSIDKANALDDFRKEIEALGYGAINDDRLGEVYFGFAEGANKEVAAIQYQVGATALSSVLDLSPTISVDGKGFTAHLSVPQHDQAVRLFEITPDDIQSSTQLNLTPTADGQLSVTLAMGRISQVYNGAGPFSSATTELCMGLDLETEPAPSTEIEYIQVKEGVCNSIGVASDRAFLGYTYDEYKVDVDGQKVGSPAANRGSDIIYWTVPPDIYRQLYVS